MHNVSQVFDEECDVFLGGLYINVAFVNPDQTLEPNVQAGLVTLGLGNITQVAPKSSTHPRLNVAPSEPLGPISLPKPASLKANVKLI